ncbi:cutinase family protein [Catellatospora sp. KI3]|uniref:cutinase family protein n=1 Tax=Catellatospora sp. KI3 TaxID=3041620 RepID=UPI0024824FB0|nr:cutinase family protein [Catellatospora sp. KI3]MDI1465153.1 cutinase family protein [Catellatospora sp. KI3]
MQQMSVRRLRRAVAATVLTAATLTAAAATAAVPAHAVSSTLTCPGVIVIGVRGTNEAAGSGGGSYNYASGGFGGRLNLSSSVVTETAASARRIAVKYPATAVAPIYSISQSTGTGNIKALVTSLGDQCGYGTRFVLLGYSQGAHVIGDALASDSGNRIAAAYRSRIAAVVFFGDPTFRYGEPFNVGGAPRTGTWPRAAGVLSEFNNRLRSYCYAGDRWCQNISDPNDVHGTRYQTSTVQSSAKSFILSKL